MHIEERILRFFEEATELAQACGLSSAKAKHIVDYVYSRPVGDVTQEVGGVGVTLLGLCASLDLDTDALEKFEVCRVQDFKVTERILKKQQAKVHAGISKIQVCAECKGRGWHVGECHPQETCGCCEGRGVVPSTP